MRQTEEERRVMEAEMSGRIQKLEAQMKEMKKSAETPVVRKCSVIYGLQNWIIIFLQSIEYGE